MSLFAHPIEEMRIANQYLCHVGAAAKTLCKNFKRLSGISEIGEQMRFVCRSAGESLKVSECLIRICRTRDTNEQISKNVRQQLTLTRIACRGLKVGVRFLEVGQPKSRQQFSDTRRFQP